MSVGRGTVHSAAAPRFSFRTRRCERRALQPCAARLSLCALPPGQPQASRQSVKACRQASFRLSPPTGERALANIATPVRRKSVVVQGLGAPPLKPRQEAVPPPSWLPEPCTARLRALKKPPFPKEPLRLACKLPGRKGRMAFQKPREKKRWKGLRSGGLRRRRFSQCSIPCRYQALPGAKQIAGGLVYQRLRTFSAKPSMRLTCTAVPSSKTALPS